MSTSRATLLKSYWKFENHIDKFWYVGLARYWMRKEIDINQRPEAKGGGRERPKTGLAREACRGVPSYNTKTA